MQEGPADEDLMLRYRDGDVDAFEILYLRHKGGVYRYLLRQCRDSGTAEEIFQDVWMKVIGARLRYTVRAKFTTWLYQVARNRLIDHCRWQSNYDNAPVDTESLVANNGNQPQQEAELQQQIDILTQLIDTLPAEQREVFILKEESGMSIGEIAGITGVNTETAKSRLRYAVNKLRRGLSRDN